MKTHGVQYALSGVGEPRESTSGCSMAIPLTDMAPVEAAASLAARGGSEWTRQLADELDRVLQTDPLERLVTLWGLSNAAAGRIFGVSRQAFSEWRAARPPAVRAAAIGDLALATDLLDRYAKWERIAAWFGVQPRVSGILHCWESPSGERPRSWRTTTLPRS